MDTPIQGHIDCPDGHAPLDREYIHISGWAVGLSSPVARVEILVNGQLKGRAGLGRFRPDVALALNNEAAELSGFELTIDLARDDSVGSHAVLSARVSLLDGTKAILGSIELVLLPTVPSSSSALAEPSRLQVRGDAVRLLCLARSLDYGGSQLRLRELVQHLSSLGYFETTVISPADGPLRHDLQAAGVTVRIAEISLEDIAKYNQQMKETAAWAAGRFDVVLAATLTSFAGVELAEILQLPVVWRIGEAEPLRKVANWLGYTLHPELEARARRAYGVASVVLFNSDNVLQIHRRYGTPGRFAVLGTGTDILRAHAYLEAHDRSTCRRELGIAEDDHVLICAGTIWPVKGQTQLVTALAHASIDRSRIKCFLIGSFREEDAELMSRLVRRNRLDESVRLIPFCHDLHPWWRAADAAICPSESESMSSSVLDAMAFGLPVLACRVGGLPEIVEDGATGWLCEPSDLNSLINGLTRFATASTKQIQRLGRRAARVVANAHDRSTLLPLMSDLMHQLSRGSRPRWLDDQLSVRGRSPPTLLARADEVI
jgi:glycosyltransferase involved in cell wall biosynthesis